MLEAGDRIAGAAGAIGGTLEIVLILGMLSTTPLAPGVAVAAVVLGVGAASWAIGTYVYDNRAEIRRELAIPYNEAKEAATACKQGPVECGREAQRRGRDVKGAFDKLQEGWAAWSN